MELPAASGGLARAFGALFRTADGGIAWRTIFSIVGGGIAIMVWVTFTMWRGNPTDAWDFWVDPAHPYAAEDIHHFAYSPAYAQAIAPFGLFGFEVYVAASRALELLCAFWLAGPVLPIALFLPPVAVEINAANINLILVTAIALGFRWPALWAVVLLTKPTMGIGLLWFALRRDWRALAIALGTTLAIAAVSFALNPGAWFEYPRAVLAIDATPGWPFPWPIWMRLPVALPLVIWGARTSRPWAVALGSMLAAPRLYFLSPVMFLGLLPLLPNAAFARRLRARWLSREPAAKGNPETVPISAA
jgi:hypothetical protein